MMCWPDRLFVSTKVLEQPSPEPSPACPLLSFEEMAEIRSIAGHKPIDGSARRTGKDRRIFFDDQLLCP